MNRTTSRYEQQPSSAFHRTVVRWTSRLTFVAVVAAQVGMFATAFAPQDGAVQAQQQTTVRTATKA